MFGKKKIEELEKELGVLANHNRTLIERDLRGLLDHSDTHDMYEIYQYPERVQFKEMYRVARRTGIANRLVFGVPKSCWSDGFKLYADEEKETELYNEELRSIQRDHMDAIERADALNRIGKFSVLFVGVADGKDMIEPLSKVRGDAIKSLYLRPFAHDGVVIAQWDNDEQSPRFGLPLLYQLNVMGRGDNEKEPVKRTILAHYTRCIHIAETKFDSEVEGLPALEPVYNRILDIDKATGGAAEAYFRNARGKIGYEIDKEFASTLMHSPDAMKQFDDAAKAFTKNWQDQIKVLGAKIVPVSTPHYTPIDTIRAALWDISAQTRLPIRLLTGEGSGQLAGSEDKLAYNVLVEDRRSTFCNTIVRQLISILAESGILADVPEDYCIEWNKQDETTELERVEMNLKRSQTFTAIANAISGIAGEAFDLRSLLDHFDFGDLEVTEIDFDNIPLLDPINDGFGGSNRDTGDQVAGDQDGEDGEGAD